MSTTGSQPIVPFLDLQKSNMQYKNELFEAMTRVTESGWYIRGKEVKLFEQELAKKSDLEGILCNLKSCSVICFTNFQILNEDFLNCCVFILVVT